MTIKDQKHYVYVLQSQRDRKFYTGCTAHVAYRLWQHNQGLVASTKGRQPLTLVYYEPCNNLETARTRERQLKRGKSAVQKHRLITQSSLQRT